MAYIDKSNVTNGNTIQATDITNIVDALDSTSATAIKILGEFAQGTSVIPTVGTKAFAQGDSTQATGLFSHAEGYNTKALGSSSHAEGGNAKTGTQNAYYATSVSSGVVTLSSSYSNVSSEFVTDNLLYLYDTPFDGIYIRAYFKISQSYYVAPNTIVELYDTSVTTTTAYVGDINYGVPNWTGNQTIPGDYSHAEGESTFAINSFAHAEGLSTSAVGINSHAEGSSTQALGGSSHSEGELTQAIGDNSHAEGGGTKATGNFSHAEGYNTQAIGDYSHAEGRNTIASGSWSHAEGYQAQTIGDYSYAGGSNTIASGSYQFVIGQNNTHGDATSLFIVGGGLQDVRKDAFKVTHSSSILIPQTQSAAPTWTGVDGEIIPATVSGKYYLYMWMSGAWRSGSFA